MSNYQAFWLIANALGMAAAISVIALGAYLLRQVVEDMSNSMTGASYLLRIFRIAPGLVISLFGCFLLLRIFLRMLKLALPT